MVYRSELDKYGWKDIMVVRSSIEKNLDRALLSLGVVIEIY